MDQNNSMVVHNGIELAATASAAKSKAEVEAAYLMALRRPRNIDDVRARILAAVRRPVFAETAEYSKPVGKGVMTGPSIRFAEMSIQSAGNIRVETTVIYESDDVRKIHVGVTDLESNIAYGKDIALNKTVERSYVRDGQTVVGTRVNTSGKTVYIVQASEDEMANKQASAESKVIRNCGLRLIPQDIIDEAMEVARATRKANAGDPVAARNKILDAFASIGVRPSEIETMLGKPMAQIVASDLERLRNVYIAIRDGEAKWSDFMPHSTEDKKDDASDEPAKQKTTGLRERLKKQTADPTPAHVAEPTTAEVTP
jgi:hypothetical protein